MLAAVIESNAPAFQATLPKLPKDLPQGLLIPPAKVRELIERERTKHAPGNFARAEEQLLNAWTIDFYFESLGHEVLYRATPHGPVVVAVGEQEVLTLRKSLRLEDQKDLTSFLDY